jgi:hypothetical protein
MTRLTVKYECKAYKIYEAAYKYKDKDVIAIAYESRNHGTLHRLYTLGSVARYAMDNCECPVSAIKIAQQIAFMQEHGDEIKFHGKTFKIVSTPNNNISLKLIAVWS